MNRKITIGILANVDAGKTTLSECLLYKSGVITQMGRVDTQNAYLDTEYMEKSRGITIVSKQARFNLGDVDVTLLDTPGHVDFSPEMERVLNVLDYAVLVISGTDGVQGHTKTIWQLLKKHRIPVFIFINKMDQKTADRGFIIEALKNQLSEGCIPFDGAKGESYYEALALTDETLLSQYLKKGMISDDAVVKVISERKVFPCYFGSALKAEGVDALIDGLIHLTLGKTYPKAFSARIFKISRDDQGNRLTHMKLTGGTLKVKALLEGFDWQEKINQIRLYSGRRFESVNEAYAGDVIVVTGLSHTKPGEGLGTAEQASKPVLEPVLTYGIGLPYGVSPREILPKLREIEEENPELHIVWNEEHQEIHVRLMGDVQTEILDDLIEKRCGIHVSFDEGRIVYKETIANTVEGVGHFEPLRHYAEVHLLLEPGAPESGMQFETRCSEDELSRNWQRLVLSHLEERQHRGVLIGGVLTDVKITLVAGRAHPKHTEGGDFREATFRAVRQGLMEAKSVLLEPIFSFQLELPTTNVGRAMTDVDAMFGTCEVVSTEGDITILVGKAPVLTLRNYHREVMAYTRGFGKLTTSFHGYAPCHNANEVIESYGYDPELDLRNPTGSVFCAQGSGYYVPWDEVKRLMHLEGYLATPKPSLSGDSLTASTPRDMSWSNLSLEEIDAILNQTYFANRGNSKGGWHRSEKSKQVKVVSSEQELTSSPKGKAKPREKRDQYLLIDGYNILFAWTMFSDLVESHMEAAKTKLLDILCNYKAVQKCEVIVVFDAYRVKGHLEEKTNYHNIHVVYTREAQTADQYIESFAYKNYETKDIVVATSDGLQQIIVRGAGSALLSARELELEIERANAIIHASIKESVDQMKHMEGAQLRDTLSVETKAKLRAMQTERGDTHES